MTPQAWYSANQGKALLVPGQPASLAGQCEQAVDCYIHDALGLPYVYTPYAHNFWDLYSSLPVLNQNFDQISNGQFLVGDIVVYASNLPGSEGAGHVDICAAPGSKSSYLGYDSNWGGNLTLHEVNHSDANNAYILGSLRLKENSEMITEPILQSMCGAYFGAPASQADISNWVGKNELSNMVMQFEQDGRRKAYYNTVQAGFKLLNANPSYQQLEQEVQALGNPTVLNPGVYKVQ